MKNLSFKIIVKNRQTIYNRLYFEFHENIINKVWSISPDFNIPFLISLQIHEELEEYSLRRMIEKANSFPGRF